MGLQCPLRHQLSSVVLCELITMTGQHGNFREGRTGEGSSPLNGCGVVSGRVLSARVSSIQAMLG